MGKLYAVVTCGVGDWREKPGNIGNLIAVRDCREINQNSGNCPDKSLSGKTVHFLKIQSYLGLQGEIEVLNEQLANGETLSHHFPKLFHSPNIIDVLV